MNIINMDPLYKAVFREGSDGKIFILSPFFCFVPVLGVTISAALPAFAMITSAGVGAYGQIQAGKAAEAEGKSQQNLANYNAMVQEREAKSIEARTSVESRLQAEEADRTRGTLAADLGASGAITTEGGPLLIKATQASESELENLMIGYRGQEEAYAARTGATLSRMEGEIARKRGKAGKMAGYIGAGSTLLQGFGMAGYMAGAGGGSQSFGNNKGLGNFNASNNYGRSSSSLNFGQP